MIRTTESFHGRSFVRKSFLAHSYIVLQHIPVSRGMPLIDELIDANRPGGICFLHFTIGHHAGSLRKPVTFCRRNVKPVHLALTLLEGKRFDEPYMQMNEYSLNKVVAHLHKRGIRQIWLESDKCHNRQSRWCAPHFYISVRRAAVCSLKPCTFA